jgi:hypothetical protein
MKFHLRACVDTDDPVTLRPVIEGIAERHAGTVRPVERGFEIEFDWEGESARDLNRVLLTELRRSVKKTRLRAEWTAGGATEKFFDYVPKGIVKP